MANMNGVINRNYLDSKSKTEGSRWIAEKLPSEELDKLDLYHDLTPSRLIGILSRTDSADFFEDAITVNS